MDGNKRWFKKNTISKYESYKKGANKLIEITKFIFENYDINYVSSFALSKHNFSRGSNLINILKKILFDFLINSEQINNFNFSVKFIGNLKFLAKKELELIKKFESKNQKCKKKLFIYLNYSGKDDIFNASKSLYKLGKFDLNTFHRYLSSGQIPDPDILIRTGGYKRISDFMLYQVSFTELFFTNKLWPDLKKTDIKNYINQFYKIDRKFGN